MRASVYCEECDSQIEADVEMADEFADAIRAFRSKRFVQMLDDLEKMLPSDFVGLADDVLKWAGKTR